MRVLLVEDEVKMSDAIAYILKENNYSVDVVDDGEQAYHYGLTQLYDVIILDVMLPKMDGLEVLQKLRSQAIQTPIIMLSAKGELTDRIQGLDYGADDYLAKPFQSEELLARLRALTRRRHEHFNEGLQYGDLSLNPNTLRLHKGDKEFELTLKESQTLEFLMINQNIVVSKEMFMDKLWGYDDDVNENTVEVYISFLRKKLKSLDSNVIITTIRNLGYKLNLKEH